MKKIKFNKLVIKNFRNINELEIKFNDDITVIQGENGLGKTNTLSAIMWCLFGKDINDVKQFPISPIINGKEDNSINTVVKIVLNDNYVIERSYCKRITSLKTGFIIDGKEQLVSITQSNYNKELMENLVDEETFKSLSNINYIPNLHWKDLKKLIFDLIGEIKDEEVLIRDNFDLIKEYIKKFGVEQTQKLLQDTDKQLNEEIKQLETEYQTLINTKEKYVASEIETNELNKRKDEIEKLIFDKQIIDKENESKLRQIRETENDINNIKLQISNLENKIAFNSSLIEDYEKLYEENTFDVETLRSQEISSVEVEINKTKTEIDIIKQTIEREKEIISNISKNGNLLKEKEIKIENDTCSECGQLLPKEKLDSILEHLKTKQLEELTSLQQTYNSHKKELEKYENESLEKQKHLSKLEIEIKNIESKVYPIIDETQKQKEIRVLKENKELEKQTFEKEKEELKKQLLEKQTLFNSIEQPEQEFVDLTPLKLELNEINEKLATTITLNKIEDDINTTVDNLNTRRNNKVVNKEKIQQVIKFNNIKADLLKQRVRNYFDIVNFKTKDFTQQGEEVETFKIVNENGVEWKDINTGHKLLLGIDLLQGIMKANEIFVPIIIDNFETLTNDIKLKDTQLIVARAVKNINKLEVK